MLFTNIKNIIQELLYLEVELKADIQISNVITEKSVHEILTSKPVFKVTKSEWRSKESLPHLIVTSGKYAGTEVRINKKHLKRHLSNNKVLE